MSLVGIMLALFAMFLSYQWSAAADRSLTQANEAVGRANEALARLQAESQQIVQAVDNRLSDLIRRAAPSPEEQAQAQFMSAIMQNPGGLKEMVELATQIEGLKAKQQPEQKPRKR